MRSRLAALTLVVLVAMGAVGLTVAGARGAFGGCGVPARTDCVRILFVGNSYTSVNDLPGAVARLGRSVGFAVETAAVAPGGQTLAGHVADPSVATAIASETWTAVVLQEQSEIPAAGDPSATGMGAAAATLVAAVRAQRASPILFETWAHRDGWPDRGLDRSGMQRAIDVSYHRVSADLDVVVAPVGDAWARATVEAPGISLWQADGSHPTAAGTYLAAAVLLRTITGRTTAASSETLGLPGPDAAALLRIAGETIP